MTSLIMNSRRLTILRKKKHAKTVVAENLNGYKLNKLWAIECWWFRCLFIYVE